MKNLPEIGPCAKLLFIFVAALIAPNCTIAVTYENPSVNTDSVFAQFSPCFLHLLTWNNSDWDSIDELASTVSNLASLNTVVTIDTFDDIDANVTTRNVTETNRSVFSGKQFTECYAIVFLQYFFQDVFPSVPETFRVLHENPDYLIFLSNTTDIDFPPEYVTLQTTGIVVLIENDQQLYYFCLHHLIAQSPESPLVRVHSSNLTHLENVHRNYSRNLNGAVVFQSDYIQNVTCSPREWAVPGRKLKMYVCLFYEIAENLNYTREFLLNINILRCEFPHIAAGGVVVSVTSTSGLNSFINNKTMVVFFNWLAPGEDFMYYTFMWIVKPKTSFESLVMEMDLLTWILTGFATVMTILAVYIVVRHDTTGTESRFESLALSANIVLPFLLDQSLISEENSRAKFGGKLYCVILIWAFVTLIIVNGYRGVLFLFMTTTLPPHLPKTIDELTQSTETIITTAAYREVRTGRVDSYLHYLMRDYFEKGIQDKSINQTVSNFYKRLKYVSETIEVLAFSQTPGGASFKSTQQDIKLLPDHHMYLCLAQDVFAYSLFTTISNNRKRYLIMQGPELGLFLQRIPIVISRTFFQPIFSRNVYQLVESGIYKMWKDYRLAVEAHRRLNNFIFLRHTKNTSAWSKSRFQTIAHQHGRFNTMALAWRVEKLSFTKPRPLKLQIYGVVYYLFTFGICLSFICCLLENRVWSNAICKFYSAYCCRLKRRQGDLIISEKHESRPEEVGVTAVRNETLKANRRSSGPFKGESNKLQGCCLNEGTQESEVRVELGCQVMDCKCRDMNNLAIMQHVTTNSQTRLN
ncbi:unnamed protein product [Allacma fusca]|uniref:Ionotropic glutamate receptor C-terminal domain-containing protein n=1 Tax=Allacma fusca TaxID=39272 RepID=A0A8J2J981_9HEXA|nr:unnamed protein product [Allacma fusca]